MRLMQVMAGASRGGAELFFERLAFGLSRAGARTPRQHFIIRKGERAERLKAAGFKVDEFSFGGPLDILTPYRIRRRMRTFEPDIVLAWMSRAAKATSNETSLLVGRLGGYYNLKYFRHCQYLVCNTEDIRRYVIAQGWDQNRAYVLPNFVPDPGYFVREPTQYPIRLLALGRFHRNKGFDILLAALKFADGVVLTLAGQGPEECKLRALVKSYGLEGRVQFVGWRNNLTSLFARADILVCPSRHEPLGNVILDAWAHGVPVIAAASQGPRQLINSGHSGVLVPVNDVAALANAIREMTQSETLRTLVGAAGRAVYESNFSEARVVNSYLDFFEHVTR